MTAVKSRNRHFSSIMSTEKLYIIVMETFLESLNPLSTVFLEKMMKNWFFYKKLHVLASKWAKMKFLELGLNRKVVGNVENYLYVKFQPIIFTLSRENGEKPHFLAYFLIWLPSICKNRHTVFRKVVDNDPVNVSGKFEASILKTFWINGQKLSKTLKNGYF